MCICAFVFFYLLSNSNVNTVNDSWIFGYVRLEFPSYGQNRSTDFAKCLHELECGPFFRFHSIKVSIDFHAIRLQRNLAFKWHSSVECVVDVMWQKCGISWSLVSRDIEQFTNINAINISSAVFQEEHSITQQYWLYSTIALLSIYLVPTHKYNISLVNFRCSCRYSLSLSTIAAGHSSLHDANSIHETDRFEILSFSWQNGVDLVSFGISFVYEVWVSIQPMREYLIRTR